MMPPIRCPTCGKVLGQYWEEFNKRIENGEDPKKVLDDMGIDRYCCRTTMLTSVDLMETISRFKK